MDLIREIASWRDYELLDSGHLKKYERFGSVRVVRPEPLALWFPKDETAWDPDAIYVQNGREGRWNITRDLPRPWTLSWNDLTFGLRLASFKHVGLFPEQAVNWEYVRRELPHSASLLNLFGYTGGASVAMAQRGVQVVHVDASKPAIHAGRENQKLSGLETASIRWIVDDAMKFVKREVRRKHNYDAILMDPPIFGRGPEGELWQFETDLVPLLQVCKNILAQNGLLVVNAYALGFPAVAIEEAVRCVFPKATSVESVELLLRESGHREFFLPAGVTVRARL